MRSDARRRAAAVVVLLTTFVAGGVAGAGLFASCGRKGHHLPPPLEDLGLRGEQRTQVEAVFEKYRPAFEAVFEASRPKMQAVRDEMDVELLPLLTEDQRRLYAQNRNRHLPRP